MLNLKKDLTQTQPYVLGKTTAPKIVKTFTTKDDPFATLHEKINDFIVDHHNKGGFEIVDIKYTMMLYKDDVLESALIIYKVDFEPLADE